MRITPMQRSGFTLIETIIYVALVSTLMLGVVGASIPVMDGAQRMNRRIMAEHENALVTRSILSLIPQAQVIIAPPQNATGSALTLTTHALGGPSITYTFTVHDGAVLSQVAVAGTPLPPQPLTSSRVHFKDFTVARNAPTPDSPECIEISYEMDDRSYGPYIRCIPL